MLLETFSNQDIIDVHGDMFFYRSMYRGDHAKIFERAKDLVEKGEAVDAIRFGSQRRASKLQTPYIVANVSKMIVDIPSTFINRSLGDIVTTVNKEYDDMSNTYANRVDEGYKEQDNQMNGTNEQQEAGDNSNNFVNNQQDIQAIEQEELELKRSHQQEVLDEIADNSKLVRQHGMNLRQWQIDGGIVAVPEIINGKPRVSFKERNVYYALDDGVTYQLRYTIERDEQKYVHVHEEVENETSVDGTHYLYKDNGNDKLELIEDNELIEEIIGIPSDHLQYTLHDRNRTLFVYLPNDPSFDNEYGWSALFGQEGKQDEVNWTITRAAQTFERNGKPRISITKDIWEQLQNAALEETGDPRKINHRNLEITTIDEQGHSLEIHQIDTSKIGDIPYVKDIIKFMLMETQTSEKAIDFFSEGKSYAESGTAKFYDLFLSLMKAERLRAEYVDFIRQAFENCLWLASVQDNTIEIERPDIMQREMLPITSKERRDMNNESYEAGTQSLETTLRNINPEKSDDWIENELERIEEGKPSVDSFSLFNGQQSSLNFNANRDGNGNYPDDINNTADGSSE